MGDGTKTALAASIAAGYLLGRGRKAKLAVALGACLASGRLRAKPGQLLSAGAEKMSDSPQLSQLADQLRGDLLNAGRYTLKAAMDKRLGTLADSLASRTESLSQVAEAAADQDQDQDQENEDQENQDQDQEQEPKAKQEDRDRGSRPSAEEPTGERSKPSRSRRESRESAPSSRSSQAPAKSRVKKAPPRRTARRTTQNTQKTTAETSRRRR